MRLNWLKCENKGNWMQRRVEATPDTRKILQKSGIPADVRDF